MANPTFVQSQIASTGSPTWTPLGPKYETTLTITLTGTVAGHSLVVLMGLVTEDASLNTKFYLGAVGGSPTNPTWNESNPTGSPPNGLFTSSGGVTGWWDGFSSDPITSSGSITITAAVAVNSVPSTPLIFVAGVIEYANPASTTGITYGVGIAGENNSTTLSIGPTGVSGGITVAMGVAVNAGSAVTAGSSFTTRQSSTGLSNNSSVVLADYSGGSGSVTLTSSSASGYALGGLILYYAPILPAPTVTLTLTGSSNLGLPGWVANYNYDPINEYDLYNALIQDPSGNLQYCLTGGVSGAVIPSFSSTPGVEVTDNECTWVCVSLGQTNGCLPFPH